jgi:hypothetical protein
MTNGFFVEMFCKKPVDKLVRYGKMYMWLGLKLSLVSPLKSKTLDRSLGDMPKAEPIWR